MIDSCGLGTVSQGFNFVIQNGGAGSKRGVIRPTSQMEVGLQDNARKDGSAAPGRRAVTRRRAGLALKLVLGTTALIALGSAGVAALSWSSTDAPQKADQYLVTRQSFDITATGNGELRARRQATLRSNLDQQAAIVEIVPEGSFVSKGDVVVRLNSDEIQKRLDDDMLQLESARSDLISADNAYQIQLSDNESALRQGRLKLEIAELELSKWREGDVVERRATLTLDYERAVREDERLKAKFERAKILRQREFLSQDELDRDEVAYIEAVGRLETARLARDVYEEFTYSKELKQKTSDVEEATAELDRIARKNNSELASKEAQLTNRRRQLQLREDRVSKLQQQMAACTLRAPTDGLVVYATSLNQNNWGNDSGPYEVGSEIRPNQEIIALPDTTEMVATVRIPEALLGRVRPKQAANVVIDAAQGKSYTGVVDSIGVMAQSGGWRDPNVREYEVRIALDLGGEAHKLKPSMRCEARIILDGVKDAITVPIQAVFNEGRRQFVYTLQGDMYAQTLVQVGRRSDSFAEIVSGLSGGEIVILREPPPGRVIKLAEVDEPAVASSGGATPSGRPARGARPQPAAQVATPTVTAADTSTDTSATDDDLDLDDLGDEDLSDIEDDVADDTGD